MASSTAEQDLQSLSSYFNNITFTQHLSIDLLSATIDAINGALRGDDLRTVLADKIPCEAFVLQEVISTPNFYVKYREFLNILSIETPSVRSTRNLLVLRILMALYDDEMADQAFTIFKENRKSIRLNPIIESDLYGNEEMSRPSGNIPPAPNISPISIETLNNLSHDQMRSVLSLMCSLGNMNSNPRPIGNTDSRSNPVLTSNPCLLYTSPSPRDQRGSRMPSSA